MSLSLSDKSLWSGMWGGGFDGDPTADTIPSVGKQQGAVSRRDHITGLGGGSCSGWAGVADGGVVCTGETNTPKAQIDNCSCSLIRRPRGDTAQGGGQQEVREELCLTPSLVQSAASLSRAQNPGRRAGRSTRALARSDESRGRHLDF